jgi:gas vesicle structural protein
MLKPRFENEEQVSLCEALDRILHKGAVVHGDVTISVAGVDLIYLRLQLVLASVESILMRENSVQTNG